MLKNFIFVLLVLMLVSCDDEEFEIESDVYYSECLVDEISGVSEHTELKIENSSLIFTDYTFSNLSCVGNGTITIPAETLLFKYSDKDLGKEVSYLNIEDTAGDTFYMAYKTTDTRIYLSDMISETDAGTEPDFKKLFTTFIQDYGKYGYTYVRLRDDD